jgi:protein-S-isoprenylcysteine O-methyltransferase Ste14
MDKEIKQTSHEEIDIKSLKKTVFIRFSLVFLIMGLVFFLSSGTIRYWEAWAYLITLAVPMVIFGIYMFKHNPKFLERRMKIKEKRKKQHLIQMIGMLPFLLVYILPGFDRRFGWSDVPFPVALIGLALVLIGYLMILYVFITNSYASRVVEVEKEQRVITTGPYALVRHPMYVGVVFFYGITPIALGSYWAMIPSLLIIPILVFRIIDEEKELLENLAGYREYTQKVGYRLVPGLW